MSVSTLDVLNEQMQLTYELANLQLLLAGSLSDRFVKNQRLVKPRTTIGFPISLTARPPYKDAVAVVEVEVETAKGSVADPNVPEPPSILTLLPREKTYNVAGLRDRMTSIGAGAVIGVVGISGSWVTGKKTYFLVQEQDTVAIQRPTPSDRANTVTFAWEFRPVLGQQYVHGGMKQTFVQLSMPPNYSRNCIGAIRLRTYWRKYDGTTGVSGDVIRESVLVSKRAMSIPTFDLKPFVDWVSYEDLGDGTLMVNVIGRFLSGTYIQLGPLRFDTTKNLQMEDSGLKFIAPAAAFARWTAQAVSRSGESADIVTPPVQDRPVALDQYGCGDDVCEGKKTRELPQLEIHELKVLDNGHAVEMRMGRPKTRAVGVPAAGVYDSENSNRQSVVGASLHGDTDNVVWSAPIVSEAECAGGKLRIAEVTPHTLNEKESELEVKFKPFSGDLRDVLLEIGGRVYGLSDTVVRRDGDGGHPKMTTVVPTASLISNPRVKAFVPFQFVADGPRAGATGTTCLVDTREVQGFEPGASIERLVLVSVESLGACAGDTTYLLFGNGLEGLTPVVPPGAVVTVESTTRAKVIIKKADLAKARKVVLMKKGARAPLVLDLPASDVKPQTPKVTIDSPVIQNTDVLEVQVENVEQLSAVKLREKVLPFVKLKGAIQLTQLQAMGVTSVQKSQELTFEFGETKVPVRFEVVAARIGVK
jgi:hypothetical protein